VVGGDDIFISWYEIPFGFVGRSGRDAPVENRGWIKSVRSATEPTGTNGMEAKHEDLRRAQCACPFYPCWRGEPTSKATVQQGSER
jgi:hypothetical protein